MELLILGIILLIGAVLIFKLIKKVVVAVFSFLLLIAVVLAGFGGLIYYDITSLANQENFVLHTQLKENEQSIAGFSLPFENQTPMAENLSSYTGDFKDDGSQYLVSIEKESFYSLIEGKTISFENLNVGSLQDFETSLTSEEVKQLLESQNTTEELVGIFLQNYSMPDNLKEGVEVQANQQIEQMLAKQNLTSKDMVFTTAFVSILNDKKSYPELFNMYKDEKITVQPETISMRMISYIPTGVFNSTIKGNTSQLNATNIE